MREGSSRCFVGVTCPTVKTMVVGHRSSGLRRWEITEMEFVQATRREADVCCVKGCSQRSDTQIPSYAAIITAVITRSERC